MANIGRRGFVKGATLGALAFSVGGVEVLMAPGEARARNVPFRLLDAHQGETLEALGETLVPQARDAGIAHYIDQQLSVPPHEALLQARIFNFRPPFADFYRAAIVTIDESSRKTVRAGFRAVVGRRTSASSSIACGRTRSKAGPEGQAALFTPCCARDAVDVVYGTMEGYEALGIPYMPHIAAGKEVVRWLTRK